MRALPGDLKGCIGGKQSLKDESEFHPNVARRGSASIWPAGGALESKTDPFSHQLLHLDRCSLYIHQALLFFSFPTHTKERYLECSIYWGSELICGSVIWGAGTELKDLLIRSFCVTEGGRA